MGGRPPRLVRIFDEYDEIYIGGKTADGRRRVLYKLIRLPGAQITYDKLVNYVTYLQQKFPDREFMLKETHHDGKTYYIITKKSYTKTPEGKIKIIRDRVPIYFDLEEQAIYVPFSYLKKYRKLAHYILMRTLGKMGIAQSKYVRTL